MSSITGGVGPVLQALEGSSLAEQAYYSIRTSILKGAYQIGTILVRRDLAEQLGMSVAPVAEALAHLEAEGLVESRPRVGTIVFVPTLAQIRGHWVVREALEPHAARLFARRASPAQRDLLWSLAEQFDLQHEALSRASEVDPEKVFAHRCLHMRLHLQVPESAGVPELRQAIERNHVLLFYWMHNQSMYGGSEMPNRWHRDLADVLCRGTPEAAEAAMRAHVTDRFDVLMRNLEAFLTINIDRMSRPAIHKL
jgi:DNA-binding GntR family transcriptional regulator